MLCEGTTGVRDVGTQDKSRRERETMKICVVESKVFSDRTFLIDDSIDCMVCLYCLKIMINIDKYE